MIDHTLLAITLGSFAASFVNAAFATGGVYIMLLVSVWVLPISAAVPLQSAFAAVSLVARIGYFWQHIQWRIVGLFVFGCLFGVYFGTRAFAELPEATISVLLGCVLLVLIWMPKWKRPLPIRHPFFFIGIAHSFLGALFGVGGVLQPFILRTGLLKLQITGTLAACLIMLDAMKVTGYVSHGFSYFDYVPHIVMASVAGFAGTWTGRHVTHHVSEELFRKLFRILVSLIAVRLIYKGWTM
ncbi:sulfite exporter TauE/SafE family protein [Oricola sp.]|uniref:sulfite exporter TauE/SafE family protein n=1 Tax=Oricola sp. TaxID=1979950 RepID=UPI0025E50AE8|nr:sulfite exporter TauE/SafE family protein [Oricola sp.]MCI5076948.1 sulfite exporter TauE/SafE family protein [Oricola sp.]